eukprot:CAMPEP_0197657488 /NCGR_PEP_ID=MMETSP1338-20131121/44659_1 /TAXON_ID=43686 ORGANISM="Pelagodinium beii, Strain RCC1491" /NCGR_SAMPLE_ID=MMETSP1338 /ASSEMBLY_ACC=CAM_ASM_000754 /LENGTH=441 /DNA_ID=CAMNT_0043233875 /DNA_START=70 /DNA_END=1392 /DNA_ORIENTATION=-
MAPGIVLAELVLTICYAGVMAGTCQNTTCKRDEDNPVLLQLQAPCGEDEMTVAQYLHALESIQVPPGDTATKKLQEQLIHYYTVAGPHMDKTIRQKGFVLDCVPFAYQPGVIDKAVVPTPSVGFPQTPSPKDKCPSGQVAIPRTRLKVLRNGVTHKKGKLSHNATLLQVANSYGQQPQDCSQYATVTNPKGYSYCSTPTWPCACSYVNVALGVGDSAIPPLALPKLTGNEAGHVLNQLWFSGTTDGGVFTSLETGWIYSSYFSEENALTAFAFSTPDDYGSEGTTCQGTSFDPAGYNERGGFIYTQSQFTLGEPLDSFSGFLGYEIQSDGFYLTYQSFEGDRLNPGPEINVGYWPLDSDRYCNGYNFDSYQAGLEVNLGADGTTASGNIYDMASIGTGESNIVSMALQDQFCSKPQQSDWQPIYGSGGNPPSPGVTFSGNW